VTEQEDRAQLEWEARMAPRAAAAAFAAALLPVIGSILTVASLSDAGEGTAGSLLELDDAPTGAIVGSVVDAIGTILLPLALGYLYRATRARRPEAPSFPLPLLSGAAVALAVVGVALIILRIDVAADFAAGADQSEEMADDLIEDSAVQPFALSQLVLRVAFGGSIVLIALNAMRAGLLSRFMGVLGIGVGAFFVVPLTPPTLILLFWGVALGFLFTGRWPGGVRGPAWGAVEAIPWPTAADRAQAARGEPADQVQRTAEGPAPSGEKPEPRPASRKRRRGR
jgi:hypothetical protein